MVVRIGAFARLDRDDTSFRFLRQHGVSEIILSGKAQPEVLKRFPFQPGDQTGMYWPFMDLLHLRQRCADAGLTLVAIENPVPAWCYDRVMLGLPGRDQQIENLHLTIRNMGRAGITTLGYHWMVNPPGVTTASWRTSHTTLGRGGAQVASFDLALAAQAPLSREREYGEDEMWDNYAYFVRAVVPVAEEAGVRLALHPDDPPVERLGGIPRLFRNVPAFERAMELAGYSHCSGLNLCLGNWAVMGVDLPAAIRHFASRGQIFYGHVQGARGTADRLTECFLDEAGCDWLVVIGALQEAGFDGILAPAHFPRCAGDTAAQYQELAYAIGYLRGLLRIAG